MRSDEAQKFYKMGRQFERALILTVIEDERLPLNMVEPSDAAYNSAIDDVVEVVENMPGFDA